VKKRINLLVFGRMPTEKAYGIHALNQAKSFANLGYNVTLFYPSTNNEKTISKDPEDYYEEKFEFKLKEIAFFDITSSILFKFSPNILKKLLWLIRSYQWSKKLNKDINSSIVWSTNPVTLFIHRKNNNLIFEQHGQAKYIQKFFIRLLKNHSTTFVGTTRESFSILKNLSDNTIYLPNAVDVNLFTPKKRTKEYGITIGYAGMFETYGVDKGVLQCVKKMLELLEDVSFNVVIIGGPLKKLNEIKDLVNNSNFSEHFRFSNRISQKKLAMEIANFDIGIIPYPKNAHMNKFASPLKIFEYLASGVICLASDLDSHNEIKKNGINFFENNNFSDFKDQLRSLISNTEEMKRQKQLILSQIEDLSVDKRSKNLLDFMRL